MLFAIPSSSATTTTGDTQKGIFARLARQPKMSITRIYLLAQTARDKLLKECSQPDHDLRLLVGHANVLDSLILDLNKVTNQQEKWRDDTVSTARREEESTYFHLETTEEEQYGEQSNCERKGLETQFTAVEIDLMIPVGDGTESELTSSRTPLQEFALALNIDSDPSLYDSNIQPFTTQPAMRNKTSWDIEESFSSSVGAKVSN